MTHSPPSPQLASGCEFDFECESEAEADQQQPQPAFLIELSPNTHSTLLAVALPPLASSQATLKEMLVTPLEAVILGHTYTFPAAIDPRSIHPTITEHSDLILRASALVATVAAAGNDSQAATARARPSIPLRAAQYWPRSDLLLVDFVQLSSTVQCATCRSTLINRKFDTVRTLPSSSWHDLVECWACHETNVVMPTSGHLGVDNDATVWVGPAHLVVKGKCAQCHTTLAIRPRHVPNAVHLLKSRVLASAASCTGSRRDALSWSLPKVRAAMVLAEVLDQVTLHAAHKIALVDLDRPTRAVLEMWTISWNCQVRTRTVAAKRAAKILYRLPDEATKGREVRSVDDLPDGYGLVVVPDAPLVVDMLDKVNLDLPESQRQVVMKPGDRPWRVSYLTA
ncbi:hypothetical protein BCR44DRAFT_1438874 [Catenaria anguillulae PL171]|uniref:Uncharacterized protein n=1 Tax=Catenaria anguillulae PL171 TaxID=765915 RepID=A0A1Y2HF26_9FUNG|nr:hypothetical protein BCR44DRAFT_1438874 [Catenaria anguillulae PL171]